MKNAILQVCDTVYKTIPGLPFHQVGTDGSIWTRTRFGPNKQERRGIWRRMKQVPDKDGYLRVTLGFNRKVLQPTGIHTYILQTFVGPCPEGMEACHKDDLKNR